MFIITYILRGRLAQLVERLPYKERVRSSSLLTPTIKDQMTSVIWSFILRVLIARTYLRSSSKPSRGTSEAMRARVEARVNGNCRISVASVSGAVYCEAQQVVADMFNATE